MTNWAECNYCDHNFQIPLTCEDQYVDCPKCGGQAFNGNFVEAWELVGLLRNYFNEITDGQKRFDTLLEIQAQGHVFYDFTQRERMILSLRIGQDLPPEHKTDPAINIQHMLNNPRIEHIINIGRALEKEFSKVEGI